ncbi:MAG: hypothetical protein BWY11_02085 [Firmicutes bacterium ADurb.Bin182]|nr:MAG: hypothetical protein BWY11_02085 [Firmicutes bacterium ADurb.Bin182]
MSKSYPVIGCCGIECGLCPRFYTEGSSKCPGCGGESFEKLHPACSFKTCCADKRKLEVCSQYAEFPCRKFEDRSKIERDSFVRHKRIFINHEMIKSGGLKKFIFGLGEHISVLRQALEYYDDGRSKSFYCIAAALLSQAALHSALSEASGIEGDNKAKAKALRALLTGCARSENVELKLIK